MTKTAYCNCQLNTSVFGLPTSVFISFPHFQISTFITLSLCPFEPFESKKLRSYGVTMLQWKKTAYCLLNTAFSAFCLPTSDFRLYFISSFPHFQIYNFATLSQKVKKLSSYVVTMLQWKKLHTVTANWTLRSLVSRLPSSFHFLIFKLAHL